MHDKDCCGCVNISGISGGDGSPPQFQIYGLDFAWGSMPNLQQEENNNKKNTKVVNMLRTTRRKILKL
jgi:hypothetical protein